MVKRCDLVASASACDMRAGRVWQMEGMLDVRGGKGGRIKPPGVEARVDWGDVEGGLRGLESCRYWAIIWDTESEQERWDGKCRTFCNL